MCGRLNVIDDPFVRGLVSSLGSHQQELNFNRFIRATNIVSIIRENSQGRDIADATWWLLLDPTENGFKPSKYTSFNTRYDKLNVPRSAGYKAFRESRCIIPAKGFGETQGKGTSATYHDFEAVEGALALGGLCREWVHHGTGETALSCSVITLSPHDKIKPYHSKASPLILPQDDNSMDMWLDPTLKNVEVFNDLLQPHLPQNLMVTQINKPSLYTPLGASVVIDRD